MTNPLSRWVQVAEPIVYQPEEGSPIPGYRVESGTIGYIHQNDPDSGLYVVFPDRHVYVNSFRHLAPINPIDVNDAGEAIREHQGEHAPRGGKTVRFDIRLHSAPPQEFMSDEYDHDQVLTAYDSIAAQELRNFMGVDVDDGLLQTIPGITAWQQEGRSGGWLCIHFNTHLNELEDQLYSLNQKLLDESNEANLDAYDRERQRHIRQEIQDVEQNIVDFYYKTIHIAKAVKHALKATDVWLSSVEAYEHDLPYMRIESDEEERNEVE